MLAKNASSPYAKSLYRGKTINSTPFHNHHILSRSPPHARPAHHLVKLVPADAARHARAAVGLEDHVLEQLLVDVLLEHGRDAPQVRQRNGPVLLVRKQPKRLVDLGRVRRRVGPAVEFQRRNGEEGLVGRVAVVVGVEDGDELAELGGGGGWYSEGADF